MCFRCRRVPRRLRDEFSFGFIIPHDLSRLNPDYQLFHKATDNDGHPSQTPNPTMWTIPS
jgi:hypothetical protein